MIARGDRPAYRLTPAHHGRWRVDTLPWVPVDRTGPREALAAIAEWLGLESDAFDVETG